MANTAEQKLTWQKALQDVCNQEGLTPTYELLSDRRGGRTAWSAKVIIGSREMGIAQALSARFWYDGQYAQNAFEDVAEVALNLLKKSKAGQTMQNVQPVQSIQFSDMQYTVSRWMDTTHTRAILESVA